MPHFDPLLAGEWIFSGAALFVVAWVQFNSPPTNRSGTTFALFFFGIVFYFALLLTLWLLVIIMIHQGGAGLGWIKYVLSIGGSDTKQEMNQFAPLVAMLFIVVASHFPKVGDIDAKARAFCLNLAAIPREADRLGFELARSTDFQPTTKALRDEIEHIVGDNISSKALKFERDGSLAARFTRAVGLYQLFIAPMNNGKFQFPLSGHAQSAYATILEAGQDIAARASSRYEDMMQVGLSYFSSSRGGGEMMKELELAISEVSNLTCNLIARYVLFCDVTRSSRQRRLSGMGFDPTHQTLEFGLDKWAITILAVMLISICMMIFMPDTLVVDAGKVLAISITFALSIGFAVMGSIVVARRFIERREIDKRASPPVAELTLAALIVAGLTVATRIVIPLVPALASGGTAGFQDVINQFLQRWPGTIVPVVCTISMGLLCSYVGSVSWRWFQVAFIGALGNGLAFMCAGALVGRLLENDVLAQFYRNVDYARPSIIVSTAITGAIIGALVLMQFRRSERVRKVVGEQIEHAPRIGGFNPDVPSLKHNPFSPAQLYTTNRAERYLGGYSHEDVRELEGSYLCLRPAFSAVGTISAYLIDVHWDEIERCLVFEERDRIDAGHTQKGRVYVPVGKPFISLVTMERGAVRVIMVSRPDAKEPARGLIMTLSNPAGVQFTPVSAPVVLKRTSDEAHQLGYIQPSVPEYVYYQKELEAVMPAFAFFSTAPQALTEGPHLVVVN
jgi:hypothetical protein